MRKWLGPVGVMLLMGGLVVAAEGTISKVDLDKKTVTIKDGDKDNEYKFTDKVKVTVAGGKAKGGKGQAKVPLRRTSEVVDEDVDRTLWYRLEPRYRRLPLLILRKGRF